MRLTLFIIFCILASFSAIQAISGNVKEKTTTKEKRKVNATTDPFNNEKYPMTTERSSVGSSIPSLIVFAISVAALLLLVMI